MYIIKNKKLTQFPTALRIESNITYQEESLRDENRGCQQEWKEPSRGTGSQGSFNKNDSQCDQNVINQQAVRPPRQKVNDFKNSTIRESDTLIIETQRREKKSEGVSNIHGQSNFKEAELNKPDDVEESKSDEAIIEYGD